MALPINTIENTKGEFVEKVDFLFLREMLEDVIVSSTYKPIQEFDECIKLTNLGESLMNMALKNNSHYSNSECKLALFRVFQIEDLLIDIEKTDFNKLIDAISKEIINENFKFPWVFERHLYDRFFENFDTRPNSLNWDQTKFLLEGSNKGVFQIGNLILGPFGILSSEELRYLPGVKQAPLWHCNNLSCNELHFVNLSSEIDQTGFGEISNQIKIDHISEKLDRYVRDTIRKSYRLDYSLVNFPFVLINAFSEKELKILLERLINENSYFWGITPQKGDFSKKFTGSPKQISEKLSINECFQIILLFKDIDIIGSLENLILENIINIPLTEIRNSYFRINFGFNMKCEVSHLGIRVVSNNKGLASLRLKHLLTSIYKDEDELEWKLRFVEGTDLSEKFHNFIMYENPRKIVKDNILDNPKHIKETIDYLLIKYFSPPRNAKEEEDLINKILWKLGFNINLFPNNLSRYWERLENFRSISSQFHLYTEDDKEKIRSSAVNFFVSVEEILDASLSFITWALLSDHYGSTKYEFNLDIARVFMAKELSGKSENEFGPITFDSKGKNTLYPLIQGFSILADYCESLVQKRDEYRRIEEDIPDYISNTDLFQFPFIHTKLILDLPKDIYEEIHKLLKQVTLLFEQNKVASVRNRAEHKREDFPTQTEIINACEALKDVMIILEDNGIIPVVFQFEETYIDTFGRGYNSFINYKGNKVKINRSSQYSLTRLPDMGTLVIVPIMKLRNSNDCIRFIWKETSDFANIYKGYPRRLNTQQ